METSSLSIATIRALGIDTINKANSGHPGMVLGSTPAIYTLFTKEMDFYHKQSKWFNRDRFVLASGHASALLYSMLHLSGYQISIDDLKNFRQWGSITQDILNVILLMVSMLLQDLWVKEFQWQQEWL